MDLDSEEHECHQTAPTFFFSEATRFKEFSSEYWPPENFAINRSFF
jgi:hypothetical protein